MDAPASAPAADPNLVEACRAVLAPLARLAVARGLPYVQLDDLLKTALVEAARAAHGDAAAHRAVSRISAATGLNRREVTKRVAQAETAPAPARRSWATEVFTRWLGDRRLRVKRSVLKRLPRQGEWPSFEALAQSVTRDVHPRTLLDEMCRLGLARVDTESDTVELLRDTFVPHGDERRMFDFLGTNVGDHLAAAVANVLSQGPRHLEQALFANELSAQAAEQARPLVAAQWQALLQALAPAIQKLIDEDEAAGRPQDHRLRVGMYAYSTGTQGDADVRT